MIPNDLNPNTFYRSFNDVQQIYGEARSLQAETAVKAYRALRRRIASTVRRVRERFHHGGTPHATAA